MVNPHLTAATLTERSTKIGLDIVSKPLLLKNAKKSKIICTLGPKCWSEETLEELLDAGMSIARFNFSHGEHSAHQEVLDRYRKVRTENRSE